MESFDNAAISVTKPQKSFYILSIVWTILIIVLAGFNNFHSYRTSMGLVKTRAQDVFDKEMAYRLKMMSFQYDKLTNTDTSFKFVDIHTISPFQSGIYGHFTSLDAKRPESIPDLWELKALQRFEQGEKEVSSIEKINDQRFFRYMRPLILEKRCLGCHGGQDLKPGDNWGGISIDVPWEPEIIKLKTEILLDDFIYFIIWVLGLAGIWFSWRLILKYLLAQKQAETELKESEERYRQLVRNLGEGIILGDKDENIIFTNPAAEQIFGVPPGRLTGSNLKEFLSPDQLSKVLTETEKRSQEEQSTYELDIITAGNQVRNLLVTATPQMNSDRVFTGTFGVLRDITERKVAEAELEKFSKELQESNATKDRFFSIIAHDLKSPFNSILGLTNVLIDDRQSLDEKEIREILSTIKKSSESAFELLENLLLWANSQTGRISFSPRQFNLKGAIEENIALVEVQASRKKIRIISSCIEDCQAFGDMQMIHTVLRNLLSNAIKFTPQGGEVAVSVTKLDDRYEISVKDTGVGIARENIPKLFKIESKYSTKGTANEKGTGLGLILCKEFVDKHGGKIWMESEVGKGSTFYFTILK